MRLGLGLALSDTPILSVLPNSIRNPAMAGAVAGVLGSGGALPTNWSLGGAAGLTVSVVGTGTVGGVPYIDISFSGTTSGTFALVKFEGASVIPATSGQIWSQSTLVSFTNLTNVTFEEQTLFENNSGGGQVRQDNGFFSATASLALYANVSTLSGGGSVAFVQPSLQFGWGSGQAVNFTLRIGLPSLSRVG